MSATEIGISIHAILLKIHVVTGWVVPADDKILDILLDQFEKKLTESYSNVNADELEYAFRSLGTTVKDWGKTMNLSLIDEVMIPYLQTRAEISKLEEHKTPLQIENKEDVSDQAMQDWFDLTVTQVREGKLTSDFIPVMLYDWKDRKGEIQATAKEKKEYLEKAVSFCYNKLFANSKTPEGLIVFNEFCEMKNSGEFSGRYATELLSLAKKMILWDKILKG